MKHFKGGGEAGPARLAIRHRNFCLTTARTKQGPPVRSVSAMLGLWPDKTRHTIYSPCDGMLDAGAGARLSFTAIALGLFPGVQGIRLCLKTASVATQKPEKQHTCSAFVLAAARHLLLPLLCPPSANELLNVRPQPGHWYIASICRASHVNVRGEDGAASEIGLPDQPLIPQQGYSCSEMTQQKGFSSLSASFAYCLLLPPSPCPLTH